MPATTPSATTLQFHDYKGLRIAEWPANFKDSQGDFRVKLRGATYTRNTLPELQKLIDRMTRS